MREDVFLGVMDGGLRVPALTDGDLVRRGIDRLQRARRLQVDVDPHILKRIGGEAFRVERVEVAVDPALGLQHLGV